ncbi:unnamed protein product [Gadus morhua 'NCC']
MLPEAMGESSKKHSATNSSLLYAFCTPTLQSHLSTLYIIIIIHCKGIREKPHRSMCTMVTIGFARTQDSNPGQCVCVCVCVCVSSVGKVSSALTNTSYPRTLGGGGVRGIPRQTLHTFTWLQP